MNLSTEYLLVSSSKTGHPDPYLELILGSHMLKTDWKDFDFLYFVGTMGLIGDYSHSMRNTEKRMYHSWWRIKTIFMVILH